MMIQKQLQSERFVPIPRGLASQGRSGMRTAYHLSETNLLQPQAKADEARACWTRDLRERHAAGRAGSYAAIGRRSTPCFPETMARDEDLCSAGCGNHSSGRVPGAASKKSARPSV